MRKAFSVDNVLNAKFNRLEFEGKWLEAVGRPELAGTWFIQGDIKNGKTSLSMQLTKYLTHFSRVAYNSVEEGLSATIQEAYIRESMQDVAGKFLLLDKESPDELIVRLKKHKSPQIIVIDTVQFWDLKWSEYKKLKALFPKKLFIYVSHLDGKKPAGSVALKIWRDANVAWFVEGFKAFPVGRYGGGEPVIINQKLADAYWGLENN
ncbi:MAG: ATP-dependent serine protease [Bacteroidales bacterium]|nr:ATP-dependent serine protease [Bacteroidales bacterium]